MITIDKGMIRAWAEERGGRPSRVVKDDGTPTDILRIDFGETEENLAQIPWEEFFEVFDEHNLAFLHQHETKDGELSRFSKFVDRDSVDDSEVDGIADDDILDDEEEANDQEAGSAAGGEGGEADGSSPAKDALTDGADEEDR